MGRVWKPIVAIQIFIYPKPSARLQRFDQFRKQLGELYPPIPHSDTENNVYLYDLRQKGGDTMHFNAVTSKNQQKFLQFHRDISFFILWKSSPSKIMQHHDFQKIIHKARNS